MSRWLFSLTPVFFSFSIRDLLKFKEEVTKERDQLLSEVVKLRESLAQTTEHQQEAERSRDEAEHTINQVSSAKEGTMKNRYLPASPFRFVLPQPPSLTLPSPILRRHPLFCLFLWFVLAGVVLLEPLFSALSEKPLSQGTAYSSGPRNCPW